VSSIVAGALSGTLLIFCFPRAGLALLAWVALVPFLYQITRVSPRRGMLAGAIMGLVFHLGNLYWVSNVLVQYGAGIGRPTSVAVLLALVGYVSLYSAAFGGLAAGACARGGTAALFVTPILWVGLEFFRKYPFGGFPWCLLGYSQVDFLPVVQIASLTGVYGVSFLLVLVNAVFAYWLSRPGPKRASLAALPVAALLVAALAFGYRELRRPLPVATFPVAAVQGNVLQEHKWEEGYATQIFARHLRLSNSAVEQGARLVVWPESSTPFHFDGTPALAEHMRAFVRDNDAFVLFGSDDYEIPPGAENYRSFNGIKLLDPDGKVSLRYHKIYLVPFGEFVPMRSVLTFAEPIVQSASNFTAGTEVVVATVDGERIGAFVCYEAIYPDLVRRFVKEGAGLLVNVTNDAWFGRSAAPYQHLDQAVLRAIETRRYLVRAANTGISAFVDPYGRLLAKGNLFVPELLVHKVSFRRGETLYVRYGYLLPRSMAVVTLIFGVSLIVLHFRDKRRDR
jgi:apolipoprotein N-acyltransferase